MPVVTISRMFGSGGSEVAALIAEQLGFALLDNAFVERVAMELGATTEEVEAREERLPSLAERFADTLAFGSLEVVPAGLSTRLPFTEERMLEVTRHVIDEAVAAGPTVLVGRGAQSYLAERRDAVHVFCYAPRSALVERVSAREGMSMAEAERIVDGTNRHREQYVKRHWHRSWLAHENYDICLNTAWLGIDGAARIAVSVARERFGLG